MQRVMQKIGRPIRKRKEVFGLKKRQEIRAGTWGTICICTVWKTGELSLLLRQWVSRAAHKRQLFVCVFALIPRAFGDAPLFISVQFCLFRNAFYSNVCSAARNQRRGNRCLSLSGIWGKGDFVPSSDSVDPNCNPVTRTFMVCLPYIKELGKDVPAYHAATCRCRGT